MSAEVMEGDEPSHKKQKLANSTSLDDELDGFDALAALDDIEAPQAAASSGPASGLATTTPIAPPSVPGTANIPNGSMLLNGVPSTQHATPPSQHGPASVSQSHPYYGGGPSSVNNPRSQTPASHPPPPQQASVLQELLLANNHPPGSSMNSPRPSYAPPSHGGQPPPANAAYLTRSPMTGPMMGTGPPSSVGPPNIMSPPTATNMGVMQIGGSNPRQRVGQLQRQQAITGGHPPAQYTEQAGSQHPYPMQQGAPPGMGGHPLPPNSVGYTTYHPSQPGMQQTSLAAGMYSSPPTSSMGRMGGPVQSQPPQGPPQLGRSGTMMVNGSPAPPLPNTRGGRQGSAQQHPPQQQLPPPPSMMPGVQPGQPGQPTPRNQMVMLSGHPGMAGTPQQQQQQLYEQQGASPYQQQPPHRQLSGDSAYAMQPPPRQPQQIPMHMHPTPQRGGGFPPQRAMMPGSGGVPPGQVIQTDSGPMLVMTGGVTTPGSQHPTMMQPMNGTSQPKGLPPPPPQLIGMPGSGGGGMQPLPQQPMMNGPARGGMPGVVSVPPGGGGGLERPNSNDMERKKLIQQQLVLLLHAHKCQQRDKQARESQGAQVVSNCTVPYCNTMKSVLEHMTQCSNGRHCEYLHCASSRQIIMHWKNCSKDDCPVCRPVKNFNASDRRQGELLLRGGPQFLANAPHQYPPHFAVTGPPQPLPPPTAIGGGAGGGSAPMVGGPPTMGGSPILPLGAFGSPPSTNAAAMLLNDYPGANSNPFREPNPPNKMGHLGGIGAAGSSGNGGPLFCLPPDPPTQQKEWHESITPDLRTHLVSKLVKAIFPSPDPTALQDQRIRDLINYAKKVEKDMFEAASDKEEYYHMLAEKIYKIQKELQEKKTKRETQLRLDSSGDGAPPGQGGGREVMALEPGPSFQPVPQPFDVTATHSGIVQRTERNSIKMEPTSLLYSAATAANGIGGDSRAIKLEDHGTTGPTMPGTSSQGDATVSSSVGDIKPTVGPSRSASLHHEEQLPVEEKVFDANELRNQLKPVWDRLYNVDEAMPFRVPVDAEQLRIPDYFNIIKRPMDLSTILKKLNDGEYRNPWEFCDDMWLMFDNAWLYNRKNSKVYKFCSKLSELFVEEINPVMRQMGYCCGQKLTFTPLPLVCYGENSGPCMIARDQEYMYYETGSSQFGVNVAEKFSYCLKCFGNIPPEGISLSDNPSDQRNMVAKSSFKLLKNDQIDTEPFVNCRVCQRRWHQICALYNKNVCPGDYICDQCRLEKKRPKIDNRYTAKKLPHCKLSRYIEDRVNAFLDGKLPPGQKEEVIIRVLCTVEKEVEVRPHMKQKYGPEGFAERFPYRTKAIFAFEMVDGVELCFFGLHVQEYGTRSAPPNTRRVYIAYLDSVHFFQPRNLRTDVYHEILLGYLQYVKQLGYTMAHIWACPPSEGDDYIFHCHPPEQKIPKPKRLQEWYKKMLEKGREDHTVYEYKDIYKQARDDDIATPMALPYFEGDYWPNIIEDCIREAEKEEGEKKRQEVMKSVTAAGEEEEEDDLFQTDDGKSTSKKGTKGGGSKKNNKSKNKQSKKKSGVVGTGNQVTDKLFSHLEKHKDVFFTIRLVSAAKESKVLERGPIVDPDPLVPSELMDGRDTFLGRARDEHWEFSSLRRAKYSTMCFTHALHTQDKQMLGVECDRCKQPAHWHCELCSQDPGFDLCENCYKEHRHEHPHPMVKVQVISETVGGTKAGGDASAASRNESVQRCINSLVHACKCKDANCRRLTCHKMKKVVQHARVCKKRQSTNACAVCKQLIALCCYHAKHCVETSCPVPFCSNIRQKLQEQRRLQNRRADMMMRRRMENMNAGFSGGAASNSGGMGEQQPSTSSSAFGMGGMIGMGSSAPAQASQGMGSSGAYLPPNEQQNMHPSAQPHYPQQQQQQQFMQNGPATTRDGGGGGGIPPGYQLVNGQLVPQQQGVGIMGQMNSASYQANLPAQSSSGNLQRVPSHQQLVQQQMNPPPYGRQPPSSQAQQQYVVAASNSPATYGNSPQGGKPAMMHPGSTSMSRPNSGSPAHMLGGVSLQEQGKMDPGLTKLLARMSNEAPPEERKKILSELKKTPHLTAAFLKITQKGGGEVLSLAPGSQQQMQMQMHQLQHWTAQQQYQPQQGQAGGLMGPTQDISQQPGGGNRMGLQSSYINANPAQGPHHWQRPPSQQ